MGKSNEPASRRGCAVTALTLSGLLDLASLTRTQAEDRVDYRYEDYAEEDGRIHVRTQGAYFDVELKPWLSLKGNYIHDAISGATPTGAPPLPGQSTVAMTTMDEIRNAGYLEPTFRIWNHSVSPQFAYSTESDYESVGISLNDAIDLNEKHVSPWERGALADPAMRAERDPLGLLLAEHMWCSREAAYGGRDGRLCGPGSPRHVGLDPLGRTRVEPHALRPADDSDQPAHSRSGEGKPGPSPQYRAGWSVRCRHGPGLRRTGPGRRAHGIEVRRLEFVSLVQLRHRGGVRRARAGETRLRPTLLQSPHHPRAGRGRGAHVRNRARRSELATLGGGRCPHLASRSRLSLRCRICEPSLRTRIICGASAQANLISFGLLKHVA